MRDSFIAFYTDDQVRPTRFLFYACFAVIASAYIAVNRLVFYRPEQAVSFEVAGLLTAMVVTAPLIYHSLLAQRRYPVAKHLTQSPLSGRPDLATATMTLRTALAKLVIEKDSWLRDERNDLKFQLEQTRRSYERSELALSFGTIVLICSGLAVFVVERNWGLEIILATAVSVVGTVSRFIYIRSEHRKLDEIFTKVYGEKLNENAATNIIPAKGQS